MKLFSFLFFYFIIIYLMQKFKVQLNHKNIYNYFVVKNLIIKVDSLPLT